MAQLRKAELDQSEADLINHAVEEAASLAADVHVYRKLGSSFIGLALVPSVGPTVKVWEH